MKYIYYTINPRERLFKQLAGFLYFLMLSDIKKRILVLPKFELSGRYYYFEDLFDVNKIKENYNVISSDEYSKDMIEDTEFHLSSFNQLPLVNPNYNKYRKSLYYNEKYYKIFDQLKEFGFNDPENNPTNSYIAVHWRQDDFLKVRPQVTYNIDELVKFCKNKLKELNIDNIYISTDCTLESDLKYINDNLPVFKFPEISDITDIEYAIIESIACSNADYFIGTSHSLYTSNIIGERNKLGRSENKSVLMPLNVIIEK